MKHIAKIFMLTHDVGGRENDYQGNTLNISISNDIKEQHIAIVPPISLELGKTSEVEVEFLDSKINELDFKNMQFPVMEGHKIVGIGKFLSVLLLMLFSLSVFSQSVFDNSVTGNFTSNGSLQTLSALYNGSNHFEKKRFSIEVNPTYSLVFSSTSNNNDASIIGKRPSQNELLTSESFNYTQDNYTAFIVDQYSSSLRRNFEYNLIGGGFGKTFKFKDHFSLSLSDALMYDIHNSIMRNSFRLKFKAIWKNVEFTTENYYQPNTGYLRYAYLYGSDKISLFNNRPFNLIVQYSYNYFDDHLNIEIKYKMIQTVSLGTRYIFKK